MFIIILKRVDDYMKKGFTLVELLGVIAILGIIGIIAFPVVNSTIKESKQDSYNAQVALIEEAAQKWSVKNVEHLPETGDVLYIKLNDLITGGFIVKTNNGKLINPLDNSEMTGCVKVIYLDEYNQYSYEYSEICG